MISSVGGGGSVQAEDPTDPEYIALFESIEDSLSEGLVLNMIEDIKESARFMEE